MASSTHPALDVIGLSASRVRLILAMSQDEFKALIAKSDETLRNALYRARGLDLAFFASYFMADHCLLPFSRMHRKFFRRDRWHIDRLLEALEQAEAVGTDWREATNSVRGWKEAYAAPRGNAKSTIKTRVECLRDACYKLEPFMVVMSNTGVQAEGRTWEVLREFESNRRIRQAFGDLVGKDVWTRGHFITRHGVRVMSAGMLSESRGIADGANRPTKVFFDDLENSEHVSSPMQRAKAEDWFAKVPLKLGGPNTPCNFSVAGTVLHRDSLLNCLLRNPGWYGEKFKAIESWPDRTDLWESCKALFCDLMDQDRLETAKAFYLANREEMDKGSRVLWPEGEPLFLLMTMLWTDGPAAFHSEKQNDPRDPTKQVFSIPKNGWFVLEQDQDGKDWIVRPDGRKVAVAGSLKVLWLDPANPKRANLVADSDFSCLVVMAFDGFGYGYVLDVYIKQAPESEYIPQVLQFNKRWKLDNAVLEDNGFQKLLEDTLGRFADEARAEVLGPWETACEAAKAAGKPLPARPWPWWDIPYEMRTSTSRKEARIMKLQAPINNAWLLFHRGLPTEFLDQVESYPLVSHDDGPDALAGAWMVGVEGSPSIAAL